MGGGDTGPAWQPQQQNAVPPTLRFLGQSSIVQQDSDPKHTSGLCQGCVTKEEREEGRDVT